MAASLAMQFAAQMAHASDRELAAIAHDWQFWGRPEQMMPGGAWSRWLILAGRGWGKTRTGAEAVRQAVYEGATRIALVGPTAGDVRDVMLFGESGLLNIFPEHERPKYEPSKRRILFHNGAIGTLYSAEKPDRLRGPQHEFAWLDELAAWSNLGDTLYNLQFGLRLGKNPRMVITTTPRPLEIIKEWVAQAETGSDVVVTRGSTYDNAANLAKKFLDEVRRAYEGTRLGAQELYGEILAPVNGLFKREWFRYLPFTDAPKFQRVVVSVDPAIGIENDETGIVVVARAHDAAYVLDDLSGRWSPDEWARRAVEAAKRYRAQTIVAEVNRGGDLVKTTIRQFDKTIPIKEVRANKGKDTRAEPVAALYEQGRVYHLERLQKLEQQMCEWDPTSQDELRSRKRATSPDRLDALVWGINELGFHLGVARLAPVNVDFPSTAF